MNAVMNDPVTVFIALLLAGVLGIRFGLWIRRGEVEEHASRAASSAHKRDYWHDQWVALNAKYQALKNPHPLKHPVERWTCDEQTVIDSLCGRATYQGTEER